MCTSTGWTLGLSVCTVVGELEVGICGVGHGRRTVDFVWIEADTASAVLSTHVHTVANVRHRYKKATR
jgi:hypothetical protein